MNVELMERGEVRDTIMSALGMRQQAASMEREAEALKKGANELLLPLFEMVGEDKIQWDGVGTATRVAGSVRGSLDKDKLKEELVGSGVRAQVVADCFEAATTYKPSADTVMFRAER